MRKIWLWSLVAGVVFLSGCGVLPQEEQTLSGEVAQNEVLSRDFSQTGNEIELSPVEALSWKEAKLTLAEVQAQTGDTTPIVVITEANSGAIVTQTGDALIYRNEVYGFQVRLGKEWKGGQIGVQVYHYPDDKELKEADIVFTLPYDRRGGSLNASIPTGMDLNSITINTISIQSHKLYKQIVMELKENWLYDDSSSKIYKSILGKSKNYYFLGEKNSDGSPFAYTVWYWDFDKDIFETLEIFDIKDVKE